MAKVNPGDDKFKGRQKRRKAGPGDKLAVAVGVERKTASTGTEQIGVRFLVLVDYANRGDEGAEVWRDFAITEKALPFFNDFVVAVGYREPYDTDDDEDLKRINAAGYCQLTVVQRKAFRGRSGGVEATDFCKPRSYKQDEKWAAMIADAEKNHDTYLAWRAANPRGSGGGRSDEGGSDSHYDDDARNAGDGGADDSIPF